MILDVFFFDVDLFYMLCFLLVDGIVRVWDICLRKEVINCIFYFYEFNYFGWFIYLFI